MKKQIKKLTLNKTTISNLSVSDMKNHLGGDKTKGHTCSTCQTCSCVYGCETSWPAGESKHGCGCGA